MLPGSAVDGCSGCSVIGGFAGCRLLPPEDPSPVLPSTEQSLSTNKHASVRAPKQTSLVKAWPVTFVKKTSCEGQKYSLLCCIVVYFTVKFTHKCY